ncbi:hypothetical protein OGAPHI_004353 [Ogataea philodendri]|uniref:Uncharacterized protein n=1 Tax=Ogataea philodendri TaxID=1378263 RepID=A0A9P8P7M8_9ASCO|nr:uncharacterized protein OGAPHI_004353 [Ogataea philodendri]KAH3666164.1 hypothetical protein OGAPHI_004353 [Ogataea philodendri]
MMSLNSCELDASRVASVATTLTAFSGTPKSSHIHLNRFMAWIISLIASSGIGFLTFEFAESGSWTSNSEMPSLSLKTQGIIRAWWGASEEIENRIPFDPISTIAVSARPTTDASFSSSRR